MSNGSDEDLQKIEPNKNQRKVLAESVRRTLELLRTGEGKQCPHCGNVKPLVAFNRRKKKYGMTPCLTCKPVKPKHCKRCGVEIYGNPPVHLGKLCSSCHETWFLEKINMDSCGGCAKVVEAVSLKFKNFVCTEFFELNKGREGPMAVFVQFCKHRIVEPKKKPRRMIQI